MGSNLSEMIKFANEYRESNNASMSYNMLLAYACEHGKKEWVEALVSRRKDMNFIKTYLRSARKETGIPYGMSLEESAEIATIAWQKYENKLLKEAEERAHREHESTIKHTKEK